MSKENIAKRKPRGCDSSLNAFRFKKDQKEDGGLQSSTPRVDFKPETKPGSPTFVYPRGNERHHNPCDGSYSEALGSCQGGQFVEEELGHLNKKEIDKTDRHGFALIHVAAR